MIYLLSWKPIIWVDFVVYCEVIVLYKIVSVDLKIIVRLKTDCHTLFHQVFLINENYFVAE